MLICLKAGTRLLTYCFSIKRVDWEKFTEPFVDVFDSIWNDISGKKGAAYMPTFTVTNLLPLPKKWLFQITKLSGIY